MAVLLRPQPRRASGKYDYIHDSLYRRVGQRTVLALVAVPVLVGRFRADHRDPLALVAGSATALFAFGGLTQRYSLGRILPLGMLALHVALGVWLAERGPLVRRRGTAVRRLGTTVALGTVLVAGIVGCRAGLARAVPGPLLPAAVARDPRLDATDAGLSFLARETTVDDVAFVRGLEAARITPALGAKVVAPGYIAPFVKDFDRRYADVGRFFGSSVSRHGIPHRWRSSVN